MVRKRSRPPRRDSGLNGGRRDAHASLDVLEAPCISIGGGGRGGGEGLGCAGVDGGEVGVPEEGDGVDGEEAVLGGDEPEVEDLGGDEDAPVADERRDVGLCG